VGGLSAFILLFVLYTRSDVVDRRAVVVLLHDGDPLAAIYTAYVIDGREYSGSS
jgi:hypothetical protein